MARPDTGPGRQPYANVDGIHRIVQDDLCHRCGACVGICPAATLALDPDGFPIQVNKCIQCGKCTDYCSGHSVDFPALCKWLIGKDFVYGPPLGELQAAYLGNATEDKIRWKGSSGGVVTQMLVHLLESGKIEGALVAIQDPKDPAMGKGIIARTREELEASAQSRYTTTPSLAALKDLMKGKGLYAMAGLPCQIHALRKAQFAGEPWAQRIVLMMGLFCYRELPVVASRELGQTVTPRGKTVAGIQYRESDGTGWPFNTVEITFTDGTKWRSPYPPNETVSILSRLYRLRRCRTCIDVTAELADLSVGDPWIRDENGRWKYADNPAGYSTIIVRTDNGASMLRDAAHAGKLAIRPIPPEEISEGQYTIIHAKKRQAPYRLAHARTRGYPHPEYPFELPQPTSKGSYEWFVFSTTEHIISWPPIRRFLLRLVFSPPGKALMNARVKQKRMMAVMRRKLKQRKATRGS